MTTLKIISIGKGSEPWIDSAVSDYLKKLSKHAKVEMIHLKDFSKVEEKIEGDRFKIALDPQGKLFTSFEFATFFQDAIIKGGNKVTLIIGDAFGIPEEIKKKCTLLSLSPLTFTHLMTKLILMEQLFRAFEILQGSSYHK